MVATGLSRTHVKAMGQEVHARLKVLGESHAKTEGMDLGWWILLDYVDVVVHLLQTDARAYYDLDGLYAECPQLDWTAVELPREAWPMAARLAE